MPESTRQRADVVECGEHRTCTPTTTSSADALDPKALFGQYRSDNWTPSTGKKRSKRSDFEKFCATQEALRRAGITALDPAVAAQNVRDSVEPGACKEALAVFHEFGCLSDTNSELALMVTMSAGRSFQRKMTIVAPEMAEQSDCYRKTNVLPLYSRCDWTDEDLEKVGPACKAWVEFRRTRAPAGCDTSKTMHRFQTMGHHRQLRNTNDQTGGLQKHQDNHWSTHEMPALTCVMSLFFELRKDGSVHFLSDAECEELGIYRIAPTQIVLTVPTGSGWQHFPPALLLSGYEYKMHAAENWALMHGVEAGPLPPNIIRASAVTWYYYVVGPRRICDSFLGKAILFLFFSLGDRIIILSPPTSRSASRSSVTTRI